MKKVTLTCIFLLMNLSAFAGEWISDGDINCQVWNSKPSPGESIKWSGQCSNGKATGKGVLQWFLNGKAGDRYEGEYRDGKMHGKGTYTSAKGNRYIGDYVANMKTGKGAYKWSDGDRYEGDVVDGNAHGFGIRYLPNDAVFLNELGSEIGRQYGTVIGLWRNDKVYKRFYGCNSRAECEQKEAQGVAEENARRKASEAELNSKDPQAMYLKAGTYIRSGDSSKGEELYEAIIRRFPSSQWAVKASDQLSAKQREDSARDTVNSANRDASRRAYQQCKIEMDICYGRGGRDCYRDCNSLY